jgi:hypothetical protein
MTVTKNLAVLGGVLLLAGVIAFAFAGYFSTWSPPATYGSVIASGVLILWGIGILLYLSVRIVWLRTHSRPRKAP